MFARKAPAATCGRGPVPIAQRLACAPLAILLAAAAGCTPAVSSVSPPSVAAGGPAFKMTVLGSGFTRSSSVQWNGSARSTAYVSATELVAQVDATDIAATGSASITVANPDSTGGTSSSGSGATSKARTISIVTPPVDATAYRIDPAHDGAMRFASVSFPASPLWQASLGAGTPSNIVIADGKVFLATAMAAGSKLMAISQATGGPAWSSRTLPANVTGPAGLAYENGRVFVSSGGSVYAYAAGSGALDWTSGFGTASAGTPTAADGLVYVVVSDNATLYALNETDGAISWQQPLAAAAGIAAVTADGLYVTATSSGCHTLDLRPVSGEVIWDSSEDTRFCPQTADGAPVVANERVYSAISSGTSIFDAQTGTGSGTLSDSLPAAFNATTAYFPQGANLEAIDLAAGTVAWTFNGDGTQLTANPILVNQDVITGSSAGNVYALDAASGKQVWRQALGGQVEELSAGDGLLLVVDETHQDGSGTLLAYRLAGNP